MNPDQLVSETVEIDAPAETIFAIVADPRQHARIDGSGSVQGVIDGPERLSKGATFGVSMKLFGMPYKISNKVVEFEPDKRIAWRHFAGHRWRYELEPTATGTRVTESFDYTRYNPVGATFLKVTGFPERNRRGITETLVRLKRAAEEDARAGF